MEALHLGWSQQPHFSCADLWHFLTSWYACSELKQIPSEIFEWSPSQEGEDLLGFSPTAPMRAAKMVKMPPRYLQDQGSDLPVTALNERRRVGARTSGFCLPCPFPLIEGTRRRATAPPPRSPALFWHSSSFRYLIRPSTSPKSSQPGFKPNSISSRAATPALAMGRKRSSLLLDSIKRESSRHRRLLRFVDWVNFRGGFSAARHRFTQAGVTQVWERRCGMHICFLKRTKWGNSRLLLPRVLKLLDKHTPVLPFYFIILQYSISTTKR